MLQLDENSDCQGFENPCGLWVGYIGVQVQVGSRRPLIYPYPWHGFQVNHTVTCHIGDTCVPAQPHCQQPSWLPLKCILIHPCSTCNRSQKLTCAFSPFCTFSKVASIYYYQEEEESILVSSWLICEVKEVFTVPHWFRSEPVGTGWIPIRNLEVENLPN